MDILIKPYRAENFFAVSELFRNTILNIDVRDYSPLQLQAWVQRSQCLQTRQNALISQRTVVAEHGDMLVGFGSIDKNGYFDLLYVKKDFQRRGIATALCDELEKGFRSITAHASVSSKPFFEQRGYVTERAQEVNCGGVFLCNYVMKKDFTH